MLKTTTKNTLSQLTIPLNRRMFCFVIFLNLSSAANSEDLKDNYSYLDCSLVLSDMVTKEKGIEYSSSYRVDYKKKEISIYMDIKNSYLNLCLSRECVLSEGLISWGTTEKDKSLEVSEYTGINRWTGKYSGTSTYRFDGRLAYDLRTVGECKSGVSKLQTKPKF